MSVPVVRFMVTGEQPSSAVFDRPYTVVYDGACTVCGRLIDLLRTWDDDELLNMVPSQTPGIRARFPWIPDRAYEESVQLIGPSGETWQGAAAMEELLRLMPKGRWAAWIFGIPFVRPIAERAYRWFARNRYHFGCGEHCQTRPLDVDYGEEE